MVRLYACSGKTDCSCREKPSFAPPVVHEALRSPAAPLDPATRARMEAALGHDFGGVRVHTDERAASSAGAVGAAAYAVGSHVVFGPGLYRPGTRSGEALIAHELTHVAQQPDAVPGAELPVAGPADPAEQEAATAAERFLRGDPPQRTTSAAPALARQVDGEPDGLASPTIPASLDCNPFDDEGFPLLKRGANRNAVGVAQTDLNKVLAQIAACLPDPKCMASLSPKAQNFIKEQVGLLSQNPIAVDCKFGLDTLHATFAVQAFFFKFESDWDGIIGPETWRGIDSMAPAPPSTPTVPPGLAPIPPTPGPISL